jgi:hypothetical protein
MNRKSDNSEQEAYLAKVIDGAIAAEIGRIDALPGEAADRLLEVYRAFMPVYIEMVRLRDERPRGWQPETVHIDVEMVEDLLHFFSDYQHIARRFKRVNRQVKLLLAMDREKEGRRYEECLEKIVSGKAVPPIMNSLVGP